MAEELYKASASSSAQPGGEGAGQPGAAEQGGKKEEEPIEAEFREEKGR
jgi:hypothetical protein